MRQKGVQCMSIKIFNSLPDYLSDLVYDKKQFIKEIKDVLIHHPYIEARIHQQYMTD
jgi:hypothetical protein